MKETEYLNNKSKDELIVLVNLQEQKLTQRDSYITSLHEQLASQTKTLRAQI